MIHAIIDGIHVEVEEGTTILQAAQTAGIEIPTLCYMKDLAPDGSCRLCVVEIEGNAKLMTACSAPIAEGNVIHTHSKKVIASRKFTLELLMTKHDAHCFSCAQNGKCMLQQYCMEYGVEESPIAKEQEKLPIDDSNPFFTFDPNLCIMCRRCQRTCEQISGRGAISVIGRGYSEKMGIPFESDGVCNFGNSDCESCGNCVEACPTGALTKKGEKAYRTWEVERVRTTCPHCGVGCQYDLLVKNGKIVGTEAADGPANHGKLCVKGRFGSYSFVHAEDRLTDPLIKDRATGHFRKATWDEALDLVASKFMEIRDTYGGDALAGFACARSANEDIYMLQKMVRTAFGTNNTDNCARVCHGPSVAGLAITLGSGAMTNTIYDATHEADLIMLVGSNPEEAHPVIGMQIREAVLKGTKLIVVDPRDIDLAKKADIHLKIKPGTNVAFSNGMIHVMIEENLIDEEFIKTRTEVDKFEELRKMVKEYTPKRVAEICHIDEEALKEAARMYAKAERAPIFYCLGVTEHSTGTEGVMAMSNMAMVTGKLGREGCGVNPIRGQNNVQGACDMGAQPADFPGYQKLANEDVVQKFEKAWGTTLNRKPGTWATECFEKMQTGEIKGLFIFGEDPVVSDPDTNHVMKSLQSLDFLVVDDLFLTETAKFADVVLPGRAYAEKEGTFSNTERRVQRIRKAVEGPGNSRLDTDIFIDLMNRMGYPQPYLTSAEIMDEIASLTPSFAGISHERLDSEEIGGNGIQWPCTSKDHPGTPILHKEKFTRGLGTYSVAEYKEAAELPDEKYPLLMMTGRVLYQYNATAMTSREAGLNERCGTSFIELNSADAQKAGIKDGEKIRVSSRRGAIETTARVSDKTSEGECWMPFHFLDGNANWLTNAALDSYCRTPEYKVCAVKIDKLTGEEEKRDCYLKVEIAEAPFEEKVG